MYFGMPNAHAGRALEEEIGLCTYLIYMEWHISMSYAYRATFSSSLTERSPLFFKHSSVNNLQSPLARAHARKCARRLYTVKRGKMRLLVG